MNISLNPFSLIKQLSDRKKYERELFSDYITEIANIAEKIAQTWDFVAEQLLNNKISKLNIDHKQRHLIIDLGRLHRNYTHIKNLYKENCYDYTLTNNPFDKMNSKLVPELKMFYENTSSIWIKKKYPLEREDLIIRIGTILSQRNLTKSLIEKEFQNISSNSLGSNKISEYSKGSIEASVQALNNEVAALKHQAKSFKLKHYNKKRI